MEQVNLQVEQLSEKLNFPAEQLKIIGGAAPLSMEEHPFLVE